MIVYSATKKEFDNDVEMNLIADKVQEEFQKHLYFHSNESEYRSWENSLKNMYIVLRDTEIDDNVRIAIEFQIPLTSKRVDFLIAGKDDENNDNVVIVELKQWEEATRTSRENIVTTFLAGAKRSTTHPSYQAYSYAKAIENFNQSVQEDDIKLYPCAYLHSFKDVYVSELKNSLYDEIIELAPLFTKSDVQKLRDFIKKYVRKADEGNLLYKIENGKIRPSKALQDSLVSMLNGNEEFVMIDEQKVVYETIKKHVENYLAKSDKLTVIVEGGAGTGKSVIAINLLASLTKSGYVVNYTTKNSAPRKVYVENLKKGKFKNAFIGNLFKNSGAFVGTEANQFDCLLTDESHRLTEKSGWMSNEGENQIKEIINAAKVSVFFIDESQQVTTKDIGSISEIKKWAKELGSRVHFDDDLKLVSQFRCNGSDGYIAFIDSLLGIRDTANTDIYDLDYDFRIFDNPSEMRTFLKHKNEINNKARMLAGYCYEWKTKDRPAAIDIFDIELSNGFKAKWNFNDSTTSWAIDPTSFEQVGCIHTSQGLEFDYVGVIIGNDLRFEDGKVITDQTKVAKSDKSSGIRSTKDKVLADKLIRNTYKTLLTRGQKGCYIYCEDEALRDYIKKRTLFQSQNNIPF